MSEKSQMAINSFKTGCNCAQSVLTAFSGDLQMAKDMALSLTSGFGGGMGKLQETCGAVTGAFMVIGLYNGKQTAENDRRKEASNAMIRIFKDKFTKIHGSVNCKKLIGADLNTIEGQLYLNENHVFENVCTKCIADAVDIVEGLISK
jgi:C_GCAxxG_C_C family probable redox protein